MREDILKHMYWRMRASRYGSDIDKHEVVKRVFGAYRELCERAYVRLTSRYSRARMNRQGCTRGTQIHRDIYVYLRE